MLWKTKAGFLSLWKRGKGRVFFIVAALMLALNTASAAELTVLTHASFSLDKKLIAGFEQQNGVKIKILKAGDAGETLNKAILTKSAPVADVFYGFDNTLAYRAVQEGILERYFSPELKNLGANLTLGFNGYATPVDYGYVALNYDNAFFKGKALPRSFAELAAPEFAKLLVVENPATSSPGLAFLLATVATFGEQGYLDFWAKLRDGGVRVAAGWEEAYYTHFSRSGGDRPLVVSYSTSPAAEVYYSEGKFKEPPTGNLLFPGSTFFQVEFVGILKGTKNLALAKKFVDWLVSKPVQENIPTQMWVYPARLDAALPEVFIKWAEKPKAPAQLAPKTIATSQTRWIDEWTKVVLQGQSPEAVKRGRGK